MFANKFLNIQGLPEVADKWSQDARTRLTDKFLYSDYHRQDQREMLWETHFENESTHFSKSKNDDENELSQICLEEFQRKAFGENNSWQS